MAAKVKFHTKDVMAVVNKHARANLTRAAIIVVRSAKANVRKNFKRRTGSAGLGGSIGHEIDMKKFTAFVGSNLKYARIQERGGVIKPKNAKKLTIPLTEEARKSRGPRFMPDLDYIPRKGRNDLLVRRDENDNIDPQWVLVDRVQLTGKPYLKPALTKNKAKITKALLRQVPGTKQGSN